MKCARAERCDRLTIPTEIGHWYADLELAVNECLLGALSFNGQRCTALKMLLVHSSVAEPFLRRLAEEMGKLKIGMPWEAGVSITPLVEPAKADYLSACIKDAEEQGARIVNPGGGTVCKTLFYPALVYPVREGMKLYREEQFGPVVPVISFDEIEAALAYVATSEHGQQVSIFSADPELIGRLVDPLVNQVCRVNINCQCQRGPDVFPFTGRKDSAEGTLDDRRQAKRAEQASARRHRHRASIQLHQHAIYLLNKSFDRSDRESRAWQRDCRPPFLRRIAVVKLHEPISLFS